MPKTEKIFDMLRFVKEYPNLTARDLSQLCNVSERGIYRYLNTLSRAGIPIRFQNGGYRLEDDYTDVFEDLFINADPGTLEHIISLLSLGMQSSQDDVAVKHGKEFIKLIKATFPRLKKLRKGEIDILPEMAQATHHGGTVTIGHSSRPSIINPILTAETISVNLLNLIFSDLVKFDNSGKLRPDLAKSWEISKDGLVWTFFLRDDVKFHDGYPLTSRDVEFTYKSIMDPMNMSPMAERCDLIDRVETEGDYIFRIILRYPFAPIMHRLGRAIAPKHLLENEELHSTAFNRCPIGSGPFRLVEWTEDDTIVLEANREYFQNDRPALDRLVFKTYPDRKEALEAVSRGEMDIALNLTASDILFMGRHGAFRVYSALGASYYAIILNLKDPIFEDIRVRKALDCAIDRESMIKNQLKGHSKICTGPFGINSWAYNPNVQPTRYNMEKAKELLRQAGWIDTDGDGILDKDGRPLEISITVPNISDSLERITVAIRAQLMKIGIGVKLVYVDDSMLYRTPFQAALTLVSVGADPDCAYRFWHSQSGDINLASYENKAVDNLLELGRRTADLEKRKAIYHEIHKLIHDDYPAIFLTSGCQFIGSNYRFRDAKFFSALHFLTTAKDWQIIGGERKDTAYESQREMNTP